MRHPNAVHQIDARPLSPAIDVYNYCVIPNNGLVYLPNLLGTVIHDRQLLILSVRAGGAALLVLTGAQCGFMAVAAGQTVSIPTTDTFFISGVGGTAYVVIGEVYLYTP